ncbi:MAG: hypothetical protein JXR59_04315, partial [Desulfuromonadaceae bacterium]|nr:hypothetical protein [Desulfuromonadaceae bacterium]
CRLRNEPLTRDYRCDSPTHQRYMRVTLYPEGDGSILMKHETLREVPFSHPVVIRDMSRESPAPAQIASARVLRCSMCNRLKLKEAETWSSPETLSEHETKTFHVIHTVCPDCRSTIWKPLKNR